MSVPWSSFDPVVYVADNYLSVAPEDRRIVKKLADFYLSIEEENLRIIEVGGGPNLYPVLAALPSAAEVTVLDFGVRNLAYIKGQLGRLSENWLEFWSELVSLSGVYADVDPDSVLAEKVTLVEGSVYEYSPEPESAFDVVSTHFCLESITDSEEGFAQGLAAVSAMTRPGGHLIASFLKGSEGYSVGDYQFPAYPLFEPHLIGALEKVGYTDIDLTVVENSGELANEDEWLGMLAVSAVRT